jgi:hypothetical protein
VNEPTALSATKLRQPATGRYEPEAVWPKDEAASWSWPIAEVDHVVRLSRSAPERRGGLAPEDHGFDETDAVIRGHFDEVALVEGLHSIHRLEGHVTALDEGLSQLVEPSLEEFNVAAHGARHEERTLQPRVPRHVVVGRQQCEGVERLVERSERGLAASEQRATHGEQSQRVGFPIAQAAAKHVTPAFAFCDHRTHHARHDVVVGVCAETDELPREEVIGVGGELISQATHAVDGAHGRTRQPAIVGRIDTVMPLPYRGEDVRTTARSLTVFTLRDEHRNLARSPLLVLGVGRVGGDGSHPPRRLLIARDLAHFDVKGLGTVLEHHLVRVSL